MISAIGLILVSAVLYTCIGWWAEMALWMKVCMVLLYHAILLLWHLLEAASYHKAAHPKVAKRFHIAKPLHEGGADLDTDSIIN
jgi:hypothetical protein